MNFKLISRKLTDTYLRVNKKKLDQLKGLEPRTLRGAKLKAVLPSLVPVLLYGSALAVLYPEQLRQLVALLADLIAILAQELGGVLLQLIPPELHRSANRGCD